MENVQGKKVVPGLYKRIIGKPPEWAYQFSPSQIEIYLVVEVENGQLIARDFEGKEYPIRDPGFHDRMRNNVEIGTLDSFDLIPLNGEAYTSLKEDICRSGKRASKLLKMMEDNKNVKFSL